MKICKKCGNKFPFWIKREGTRRNLGSRKYCLDCSPFGMNNTRQLEKQKDKIRVCRVCGRRFDNIRGKGHCGYTCNSCFVSKRVVERKQHAISYKGGKCIRCGYNKCLDALEFHHRDPSEKSFQISGNHCLSWIRVKAELDKCDLVCANCHREIACIKNTK